MRSAPEMYRLAVVERIFSCLISCNRTRNDVSTFQNGAFQTDPGVSIRPGDSLIERMKDLCRPGKDPRSAFFVFL